MTPDAMSDDELLLHLAAEVADGDSIDWSRVRADHPELSSRIDTLERLEQIASGLDGELREAFGELAALSLSAQPPKGARAFGALGLGGTRGALFTWGPFRVIERLGQGAFGEVYRALDPVLHREVALKLRAEERDPARIERQLEEARRLARVKHPNVLTIHGAAVHDHRVGLWTDLVLGSTLEERLEREGHAGAEETALIALDLCRALAAVHGAGLLHGDVKTGNVMRESGGRIVLMDFGAGADLTGGNAVVTTYGTPLCAAPEVIRGEAPSVRADLYSLGVLLYRLLTRRYPIEAESHEELEARHRNSERTLLRERRADVPLALVQVIERCLEADPAARFGSAAEVEAALAEVVSARIGESGQRPTAPSVEDNVPARQRWIVRTAPAIGAAALVGAGLVGAGLVAALLLLRGGPAGPAVKASLYLEDGAGRAEVQSGARVGPGDQLSLELESAAPVYTYVLDEDDAGNLFVLFPVAGLEPGNPLRAGERFRLPGAKGGTPQDWVVTSAGGREVVLVVCAREPVAVLESRLAALPAADPSRGVEYASLANDELDLFRGIGGIQPAQNPQATQGNRLRALAEELSQSSAPLWVKTYELLNP